MKKTGLSLLLLTVALVLAVQATASDHPVLSGHPSESEGLQPSGLAADGDQANAGRIGTDPQHAAVVGRAKPTIPADTTGRRSFPTAPAWASSGRRDGAGAGQKLASCETQSCSTNVSCPAGTTHCGAVERNCLLNEPGHVTCDGQTISCEPCEPTCHVSGSNCLSEAWCQAKCQRFCNSSEGACGGGKCYCGVI